MREEKGWWMPRTSHMLKKRNNNNRRRPREDDETEIVFWSVQHTWTPQQRVVALWGFTSELFTYNSIHLCSWSTCGNWRRLALWLWHRVSIPDTSVWTVIATGLFSTNRRCRIEDIQTINVKEKLFYRGKLPDIQSAVFYHRLTFNTTNVLLCEACFGHIRAQCELDTQNHCHLLILLDRTFYETELTPNHCGW